jgi:hypothetical protein
MRRECALLTSATVSYTTTNGLGDVTNIRRKSH